MIFIKCINIKWIIWLIIPRNNKFFSTVAIYIIENILDIIIIFFSLRAALRASTLIELSALSGLLIASLYFLRTVQYISF